MAAISKAERDKLPASAFVYPKTRAYPIHDRAHARAALLLSARSDTSGDPAKVRRAVKRRFPDLLKGGS
ncbi:MAG: hypothetical protein M3P49_13860 [Actinomycetota bacterium]|nr:hypothetical protein [Actinomycetota bacterium]